MGGKTLNCVLWEDGLFLGTVAQCSKTQRHVQDPEVVLETDLRVVSYRK